MLSLHLAHLSAIIIPMPLFHGQSRQLSNTAWCIDSLSHVLSVYVAYVILNDPNSIDVLT